METDTPFKQVIESIKKLFKAEFWPSLGALLLPQVVLFLPALLMMFVVGPLVFTSEPGIQLLVGGIILVVAMVSLAVYSMYLTIRMTAGLLKLSVDYLRAGTVFDFKAIYRAGKGSVWRYFAVSFVAALMIIGGLILLIVPGVILMLRYAVAAPAAIVEDLPASQSLARSKALTKGNYGLIAKLIGVMILISILSVIPVVGFIVSLALTPVSVFGMSALYVHFAGSISANVAPGQPWAEAPIAPQVEAPTAQQTVETTTPQVATEDTPTQPQ